MWCCCHWKVSSKRKKGESDPPAWQDKDLGKKTLTSSNKESGPFSLATITIIAFGVFPLFLPLANTAFGGPDGCSSLAILAFGAFEFMVPRYEYHFLTSVWWSKTPYQNFVLLSSYDFLKRGRSKHGRTQKRTKTSKCKHTKEHRNGNICYSGRAKADGPKVTERAQNADFRRKPQIFAESPLLLEIPAFGGRPETAESRRFSQKTEDFRHL